MALLHAHSPPFNVQLMQSNVQSLVLVNVIIFIGVLLELELAVCSDLFMRCSLKLKSAIHGWFCLFVKVPQSMSCFWPPE